MGEYYDTFKVPFFLTIDYKSKPLQVNAKAYDRPDSEILADLSEHFMTLHGIDASKVKISSEKEVVHLEGEVISRQVKDYLAALAANTLGVREVRNDLAITRTGAQAI